jgi:hypothetical protein
MKSGRLSSGLDSRPDNGENVWGAPVGVTHLKMSAVYSSQRTEKKKPCPRSPMKGFSLVRFFLAKGLSFI